MDLWEMATLVGTVAATGVAVVGLVWRMLRDVRRDLGQEIEKVRREGREAHAKIGEQIAGQREGLQAEIAKVRSDLSTEIGQLRKDMRAETAQVRDGLGADIAEVGRELAGVRGELKGVTRSVDTLREDFRAHVLAA